MVIKLYKNFCDHLTIGYQSCRDVQLNDLINSYDTTASQYSKKNPFSELQKNFEKNHAGFLNERIKEVDAQKKWNFSQDTSKNCP